jgi:hypothetical protein
MKMFIRSFAVLLLFVSICFAQGENRERRINEQNDRSAAAAAGEAVVTISESFVNSLLDALLRQPRPPTFPLRLASIERQTGEGLLRSEANHPSNAQGCASEIMLQREISGVRTAVRFRERSITAPIAFRGSYSAGLLGCFRFTGWADTEINLDFDRARQRLVARVRVRDVNLSGVPGLASGAVTGMVQNSIDERINPIEILRAEQLGARIPVPNGDDLHLRAREVQTEVLNGELRLRIFYEVGGS